MKSVLLFLSLTAAAHAQVAVKARTLYPMTGDLAPLTTLMDAARAIGEDLGRLAEAQREVEDTARR